VIVDDSPTKNGRQKYLRSYINLIPHVRDEDEQIQTDGLCPFENESPTGNLKKPTQVYTDTTD